MFDLTRRKFLRILGIAPVAASAALAAKSAVPLTHAPAVGMPLVPSDKGCKRQPTGMNSCVVLSDYYTNKRR